MRPDFAREVHAVLGLPFDRVDLAGATARVAEAARRRERCFLSTPNLDFAVHCQDDEAFRASVLESDLCIADGWPIVMAARLLGAPLAERVAGSDLFERLHGAGTPPIRVYFFGGPPGAAQQACERVNARGASLVCVGHHAPGFGSVDEMSAEPVLRAIDDSGADFLVVALGAKKGQAWIRRNLPHLRVPVLSHLGAVVNFEAGTVRRAPRWMQRLGLEWLWRVVEEPALWRRYAVDARVLLRLLFGRVLPLALRLRLGAPDARALEAARFTLEETAGARVLRLEGAWCAGNLLRLRQALAQAGTPARALTVDLGALTHGDTALVGLLMLLYAGQRHGAAGWRMPAPSAAAVRLLRGTCADFLLAQAPAAAAGVSARPAGST